MSILTQVTTMTQPRIPDPPEPGTYWQTFQRELAASEQATTIGAFLMNAHWLLEGWLMPAGPWNAEQKRIYTQHACEAIRACSSVEQNVAVGRAIRYVQQHYLKLRLDTLKAQSDEEVQSILAAFTKAIIGEYRFHLAHGAGVLSPADQEALNELYEELGDDPRRI